MTRQECKQLVDAYVDWLRRGLSVESLDGACELTTPFLDRHNDHLQVYAVKRNGKIVLSDDGYILSDLRASGLELITPKRKAVVETMLRGHGIHLEGNQLLVEASPRNVGQRLHSLIQAMLAVNDMFVMAQPRVATFFWEDVREFLDQREVRYSPRVKLAGRSGYDHAIDFLIPRSARAPERIVQAINAPQRSTIGTYLFVLGDTREARGPESEAYAFLNDRDREVGGDVIEALEAYEVVAALWSHREEFAQRLAA
jgi:Domain of unknown function DUF1828/Domain of unknown function DUF1829